jgi:cytochrome c peroxidase
MHRLLALTSTATISTVLISAPAPHLGLPATALLDAPKVALGAVLFRSTAASADGHVSCASCHDPALAFSDGRSVSVGVFGRMGTRNAPALLNSRFNAAAMWDGRRTDTADQVLRPLTNPAEHGMATLGEALRQMNDDPQVQAALNRSFPEAHGQLSEGLLKSVLTEYVRSLVSGGSAFDKYQYLNQRQALSSEQQRGYALFKTVGCASCHTVGEREALFTDGLFHSSSEPLNAYGDGLPALSQQASAIVSDQQRETAITSRADVASLGRFVITHKDSDLGAFRTPSLRDVAKTAPYFHDGGEPTLEGAVRREVIYRNSLAEKPLVIDALEVDALVAFLKGLDSVQ